MGDIEEFKMFAAEEDITLLFDILWRKFSAAQKAYFITIDRQTVVNFIDWARAIPEDVDFNW